MIAELSVIIALVIGLTEVAKRALKLPKKFIPLTSLIIGLIVSLICAFDGIVSSVILSGIIAGLSAVGLYSGVKNTIGK